MDNRKILFADTAHPLLTAELEKDGWVCQDFSGTDLDAFTRTIGEFTGLIIRSKFKLDRAILEKAVKLKFIGRVGAGLENIDVSFAESRGIACLNAPEGNRDAVGEQAVGMLLMLFNNLRRADAEVRKGLWRREVNRGQELGGKTVGIIGYGNTGGAFARKLAGFGTKVLAYDKYKKDFSDEFAVEVQMAEIFSNCDVVSLHVPLTEETTFLANSSFFRKFRKDIWLINTSRGKVVHTAELMDALRTGKVLGACLDVLEYEGLTFENLDEGNLPAVFRELVRMDNVVLSPHIAGWTDESAVKLAKVLVEKIRKLDLDGGVIS